MRRFACRRKGALDWRDGTTHIVFEPVELLERLAAPVPRPRVRLIPYHGVLAPRQAWRREIVPVRARPSRAPPEEGELVVVLDR
jgi:hypothetical protein